MALQIIRNNIIKVQADAIVNTANPKVAVGRGVDFAIYEAAGREKLLAARAEIGEMEPGSAVYTPAFDLDAKYIIHTVGPAWRGGGYGERETVAACYRNSLKLAKELECESIAFPLIATGTYGFPKDEALRIAIAEISSFLLESEMEVTLVVYDKESFRVSGKLFSDIRMFIGDSDVDETFVYEAPRSVLMSESVADSRRPGAKRRLRRRLFNRQPGQEERALEESKAKKAPRTSGRKDASRLEEETVLRDAERADYAEGMAEWPADAEYIEEMAVLTEPSIAFPSGSGSADGSISERLAHMDKSFQEYLFMLIDRKGLTDPDVYKKANIDRKHFSKIRSNPAYTPSKRTALALALALELSLDETKDLLARAGLTLSPSIRFDTIIQYCIETKRYNIYDINCILFEYDEPLLGA